MLRAGCCCPRNRAGGQRGGARLHPWPGTPDSPAPRSPRRACPPCGLAGGPAEALGSVTGCPGNRAAPPTPTPSPRRELPWPPGVQPPPCVLLQPRASPCRHLAALRSFLLSSQGDLPQWSPLDKMGTQSPSFPPGVRVRIGRSQAYLNAGQGDLISVS